MNTVLGALAANIELIKTINGIRDINDFVPFLSMKPRRLKMITTILNIDSCNVDCGNRCYYLAKTLKVEPFLVNLYVTRRLFVLALPWSAFCANLKCMLDFKVEPLNILKDLWYFRYDPYMVRKRLQKAKKARKKPIKPWIIRCTDSIFKRFECH